jgi:hypothetical protein
LSSHLLSKNLNGKETWSLTLREERKLRVFENRVLRRIFGPKRDKVTRDRRKLHNEELHNLYFSPNIIRMTKPKGDGMGGACSAHGGDEKCKKKIWLGSLKERDQSEDLGIHERIILKWILRKQFWRVCIGLIWLRIGTGGGFL